MKLTKVLQLPIYIDFNLKINWDSFEQLKQQTSAENKRYNEVVNFLHKELELRPEIKALWEKFETLCKRPKTSTRDLESTFAKKARAFSKRLHKTLRAVSSVLSDQSKKKKERTEEAEDLVTAFLKKFWKRKSKIEEAIEEKRQKVATKEGTPELHWTFRDPALGKNGALQQAVKKAYDAYSKTGAPGFVKYRETDPESIAFNKMRSLFRFFSPKLGSVRDFFVNSFQDRSGLQIKLTPVARTVLSAGMQWYQNPSRFKNGIEETFSLRKYGAKKSPQLEGIMVFPTGIRFHFFLSLDNPLIEAYAKNYTVPRFTLYSLRGVKPETHSSVKVWDHTLNLTVEFPRVPVTRQREEWVAIRLDQQKLNGYEVEAGYHFNDKYRKPIELSLIREPYTVRQNNKRLLKLTLNPHLQNAEVSKALLLSQGKDKYQENLKSWFTFKHFDICPILYKDDIKLLHKLYSSGLDTLRMNCYLKFETSKIEELNQLTIMVEKPSKTKQISLQDKIKYTKLGKLHYGGMCWLLSFLKDKRVYKNLQQAISDWLWLMRSCRLTQKNFQNRYEKYREDLYSVLARELCQNYKKVIIVPPGSKDRSRELQFQLKRLKQDLSSVCASLLKDSKSVSLLVRKADLQKKITGLEDLKFGMSSSAPYLLYTKLQQQALKFDVKVVLATKSKPYKTKLLKILKAKLKKTANLSDDFLLELGAGVKTKRLIKKSVLSTPKKKKPTPTGKKATRVA